MGLGTGGAGSQRPQISFHEALKAPPLKELQEPMIWILKSGETGGSHCSRLQPRALNCQPGKPGQEQLLYLGAP